MYIVTGAAGLIGSATIWALNQRGITDIIAVDHLGTSDKWKNLRALKYVNYYEKEDFLKCLKDNFFDPLQIQGIIHLGACSSTTERDATYLIHNNFEWTKEIASFAHLHKIPFCYASSAATYGGGEHGYLDSLEILPKLRPLNMYGYSKHLFDLWALNAGLFDQIIGLKFTNVYGPNELHKGNMRSVPCRAFYELSETGMIQLFKSYKSEYQDGEQKRDFLYVKDAVEMMLFLLFNRSPGGLYNIGSGRAETWNSLANAAFQALQKKTNIQYIEMPESLRDRYQYYTCADISKIRKIGYTQEATSLKEAIHDYYCNYLACEKFLGDES